MWERIKKLIIKLPAKPKLITPMERRKLVVTMPKKKGS